MFLVPIIIRYVSESVTLYEEHPDALYVLCKLQEATIMLLVGLWSL